jgi:hypothetical protein
MLYCVAGFCFEWHEISSVLNFVLPLLAACCVMALLVLAVASCIGLCHGCFGGHKPAPLAPPSTPERACHSAAPKAEPRVTRSSLKRQQDAGQQQ